MWGLGAHSPEHRKVRLSLSTQLHCNKPNAYFSSLVAPLLRARPLWAPCWPRAAAPFPVCRRRAGHAHVGRPARTRPAVLVTHPSSRAGHVPVTASARPYARSSSAPSCGLSVRPLGCLAARPAVYSPARLLGCPAVRPPVRSAARLPGRLSARPIGCSPARPSVRPCDRLLACPSIRPSTRPAARLPGRPSTIPTGSLPAFPLRISVPSVRPPGRCSEHLGPSRSARPVPVEHPRWSCLSMRFVWLWRR